MSKYEKAQQYLKDTHAEWVKIVKYWQDKLKGESE